MIAARKALALNFAWNVGDWVVPVFGMVTVGDVAVVAVVGAVRGDAAMAVLESSPRLSGKSLSAIF